MDKRIVMEQLLLELSDNPLDDAEKELLKRKNNNMNQPTNINNNASDNIQNQVNQSNQNNIANDDPLSDAENELNKQQNNNINNNTNTIDNPTMDVDPNQQPINQSMGIGGDPNTMGDPTMGDPNQPMEEEEPIEVKNYNYYILHNALTYLFYIDDQLNSENVESIILRKTISKTKKLFKLFINNYNKYDEEKRKEIVEEIKKIIKGINKKYRKLKEQANKSKEDDSK
jgi:hypothetical protein